MDQISETNQINETMLEMAPESAVKAWDKLYEHERRAILRAWLLGRMVVMSIYYIGGSHFIASVGVSETKWDSRAL